MIIIPVLLVIGFIFESVCEQHATVDTLEIAKKVTEKGDSLIPSGTYQQILNIQAKSEIAGFEGDGDYLRDTRELCAAFGSGEIVANGNFICYEAGGSGCAYLLYKGLAPEIESHVLSTAEKMISEQPRSSEGLMVRPYDEGDKNDPVFIDVAFAVTPYMLYTGLAFDEDEFIDYAVFETIERINILKDQQTGLVHQARGFQGKGRLTRDNWSRGNGWAALALASLIRDLPESHEDRSKVERIATDFFKAVLKHQNREGLWHQEITDTTSFVETSGSGLMLYGLGVAVEQKLLSDSHKMDIQRGLINLMAYIEKDGSISHTSEGLLALGDGTKEDYKQHPWSHNEPHAFGAVSLAYIQAAKLGIEKLRIPFEPGYLAAMFAGE